MNNDLVKFHVPGEFITERVDLSLCELAYGYQRGWIQAADAVHIALTGLKSGRAVPSAYEELALLLSDRLDRVQDLIAELVEDQDLSGDCAKVWLYLALAWLFEHRSNFLDPLSLVEQIYTDFDYPGEIEDFVRFLPVAPGNPVGESALYARWNSYLERTALKYGSPSSSPE